jgi:5-methyltetrahydropteroyltriglutamate--homocysteine methyltransferase
MNTKTIKTASLGFSRIGKNRELKFALEKFWSGKISQNDLEQVAKQIRLDNWKLQTDIDYIPSGDFSYYDHVLDLSFEFNNIPTKFNTISDPLTKYFALARGYQKNGLDLQACELSKWFNTNYHYIVPEFYEDVVLKYIPRKFVSDFLEAKSLGYKTRPVIIGPVSYLLLGKAKTTTVQNIFSHLLKCYTDLFLDIAQNGCSEIQIDEPFLCTELSEEVKLWYKTAFDELAKCGLEIHLVSYFDEIAENLDLALSLPVKSVHIDVSEFNIPQIPQTDKTISIGIVNGRNIWKNDLAKSFKTISKVLQNNNVIIATSCSLLHVPYSLDSETNLGDVKNRLAFAKEKIDEIVSLATSVKNNQQPIFTNSIVNKNSQVWQALKNLDENYERNLPFEQRKQVQKLLSIPLFATTTIGSFPQDDSIRKNRADFKNTLKTEEQYEDFCKKTIADCIKRQEEIGLDVLVHGECERNDMVEYFGENLEGFCFTKNGWVQSYGSRCVKPPIIYGDVARNNPITVQWAEFAQSCSKKHVKGMLTGPVTILKWSFVRDDISLEQTCKQIAIALQGEVLDLEACGIKIIQIDEPAIREILPVRRSKWDSYLKWAVDCFKISAYRVKDSTQIHTHICYSEFNDIIDHILRLDADVLSIESSRSDLEILSVLKNGGYKNDIGPGVWDIHSPRIPSESEISNIIQKSLEVLKPDQIWINPDCGLKTRGWQEVELSLKNLVSVAKKFRNKYEKYSK